MKKRSLVVWGLALMIGLMSQTVGLAAGVEKVSLKAAINTVLQQNLDLQMAQVSLDNAELGYKRASAANLLTESVYNKLDAEQALLQGKLTFRQTKEQLISGLVQQYVNILLAEKDLTMQRKEVELEKKILTDVEAQVKLGYKGRLEQLQQTNKYHDTLNQLESAEDNYALLVLDFKTALGLKVGDQISLEDLKYPASWKVTEKDASDKAIANSINLELKKRGVELAKIDVERVQTASAAELDLASSKNRLKLAQLQEADAIQELRNSVQKQYYTYQQACKNLKIGEQRLNEVKESYRVLKEQKNAGLKTASDLLSAEISLIGAEYSYKAAIGKYYSALLQLQQTMGLEIGVYLNELD